MTLAGPDRGQEIAMLLVSGAIVAIVLHEVFTAQYEALDGQEVTEIGGPAFTLSWELAALLLLLGVVVVALPHVLDSGMGDRS